MNNSTSITIVCLTAITLAALGAAVVVDVSAIIAIVSPVVAGFFLLLQVRDVKSEIRDVKGQINGRLDAHAAASAEGAATVGREAVAQFVTELGRMDMAAAQAKARGTVTAIPARKKP